MNDLEPWKIWAVTAALVCMILGITSARLRPTAAGSAEAQASTLAPEERSVGAPAGLAASAAEPYEAYSFYIPHRSFGGAGFTSIPANAGTAFNNLLYGSASASALWEEYHRNAQLDVAQQMLGNRDSQGGIVAANEDQVMNYTYAASFYGVDDQSAMSSFDRPAWVFPAARDDLALNVTDSLASINGNTAVLMDTSGNGDARLVNLGLQNAVINLAISRADSNGTAAVLQAVNDSYLEAIPAPVELDGFTPSTNQYLNQAFSGELDAQLGDEQQVIQEQETQALRAEAQALAQAQAQAQLQAALQQRAQALNAVITGTINAQINGIQFSLQPDE